MSTDCKLCGRRTPKPVPVAGDEQYIVVCRRCAGVLVDRREHAHLPPLFPRTNFVKIDPALVTVLRDRDDALKAHPVRERLRRFFKTSDWASSVRGGG